MDAASGTRVPRKRTETRRRLLAAARALLLEQGLAKVGVDTVTERAGYTRGAFYSNFISMNDLVFALYEEHTAELVNRLHDGRDGLKACPDLPLEDAIRQVVVSLPFDIEWFNIRAGFAAQAARDSRFALQYLDHETRFHERLEPILVAAVHGSHRKLSVDASVFTRALIAAHDGALANSLGDADPDGIRVLVCTAVALGLTRPIDPAASETVG